ncbi:MAG TPA: TIGR03013 family XrtA/PEP-CTERM system glycosyltransferase [Acidobacteriota bacterium]|nr:TIGR03013 family XrtA/PEP-CTERM system glycosyltransferase [Acidobacteriota bacterium]
MWRYLVLRKLGAVFVEAVLLVFCVLAAHEIRLPEWHISSAVRDGTLLRAILMAAVFQLSLHLNDIYGYIGKRPSREYVVRLCQALALATVVLCVVYYIAPELMLGRGVFGIAVLLSSAFLVPWHTLVRFYVATLTPHTNLLVLGTGNLAREAVKEILAHPELGIKVLGFVGDNPKMVGISIVNPKVIGVYDDLPALVASHKVDRIVVGLQDRRGKLPIKELLDFKTRGIAIEDATTFYERVAGKIPIENLKPSWMVFNTGFSVTKRALLRKRILSVLISSVLLVLFSPVILLLAVLIKMDSKGPVFYRQERVGQDGKTFTLAKFRSMFTDAEAQTGPVWSKEVDDRITRVGRFLRRTRFDELPQFYNVLRGDMSLVGPRPERPHFVQQLAESIPYYPLRHIVKPGITGWAQINYGYANSLEHTVEKLQYDLFYIKNMSWVLDSLILLETIKTVLVRKGS